MNDRLPGPHGSVENRLAEVFAAQRRAFAAHPYPTAAERRAHLQALKRQLHRYQDLLVDAIGRDFGFRAPTESKVLDLLAPTLEINHAISHLRRWMRPSRRSAELLFATNALQVRYQPKGVVGVIVPWNLPLYLSVGPLAAALAAGNRVMIKMSELTPATNAVLRRLIGEVFGEDRVAVFGEELPEPGAFTALAFDHIVFTGSPAVGRAVMRCAAANLTPVTLELGGKSPAVVMPGYPIAEAATRIAHGKTSNCGQICVSPDYALVPHGQIEAFVAGAQAAFHRSFGARSEGSSDYTALVNERHHARILALLDDARAKGACIVACGDAGAGRQMPLQIVTAVTSDMRLAQEEIFGPILPVIGYDTLDEAVAHINRGPRPLALYAFGHDSAARADLLRRTHSGGVAINDWGWQVLNHDAPFGGIGNSGMGSYHGIEGFRELSHARTVFKRRRFFPIGLFYPPYESAIQRLVLKLWLGKADPTLRG